MSRAATSEYIGMKRRAYAHADRAVLAAYGLAPDTPEPEIVAHLFRLYKHHNRVKGNC